MTRIRATAYMYAALTFTVGGPAACTSANPGTPGADAGSAPDSRSPVDADLDVFDVLSSVPISGARGVSVWTIPRVELSADIDPNSLDTGRISLVHTRWENRDIRATAADGVLTATPLQPLSYGQRYTLHLSGITDRSGRILADTAITFTTSVNPKTREDRREGGNVYRYTRYENTADGRVAKRIQYDGRGDDATWFTGDDRVIGYTVHAYEPAAPVTGTATYDGPGADGVWFTGDDTLASIQHLSTDNGGLTVRLVNLSSPGPDGLPLTDDDEVRDYQTWTHSAASSVTTSFEGPGPDGRWFTGDDAIRFREVRHYDATRRLLSWKRFDGPGEDEQWNTADDRLAYDYTYVYGATTQRTISRAGTTSRVQWYVDKNLLANGENIDTYDGPGEDGVWFTGDDRRATHDRIEKQDGRVVQATRFSGDQGITRILGYEYEPHGSRTRSVEYDGPGNDGAWGTADDRIANYVAITYDDHGNRVAYRHYDGAGEDKQWFTDDDQLSQETLHDPSI